MTALANVLAGERLNFNAASELFTDIMNGALNDIELSALLIALKTRGETTEEIAGAAHAMREHATALPTTLDVTVDSCGTGGDGANTINVSTTAALVAASMGIPMAKHGNRSVSSRSGSADLLESLGININQSPEAAAKTLEQTNFSFLFAPNYHTGVKHAMKVRTTLKTRTLFNVLGPLANPAKPKVQLLGVYQPELITPMVETLKLLGCERALVVHGAGTDEIALHGDTHYAELNQGEISYGVLSPTELGLTPAPLVAIQGGEAEQNAEYTCEILKGNAPQAMLDAVIANVAALLYLTGKVESLIAGSALASAHLKSGAAYNHLLTIAEVSHG